MSSDVIQAKYDGLEAIAARFGQSHGTITTLNQAVTRSFKGLEEGGWQGRGANAFFAEMHGALLAPQATGIDLQETGLLAASHDIGARSGIGLQASEPDVHISIYLFDSQAEHQAAVERLQSAAPRDGSYVVHTSNGALLFFGYTATDGTICPGVPSRIVQNTSGTKVCICSAGRT